MNIPITPVQVSNSLRCLGWVLLFIFLWFRGCSDDCGNSTTNVKVPEVTGKFEPAKPDHTPVVEGEFAREKLSKFDKSKNSKLSGKSVRDNSMDSLINAILSENEQLSRDFYFASDSLKKLKYQKAIQLNTFSQSFEDKNIKIDMQGIVRGEVQSIQPFYTIKEREIDVPVPFTKFRLLAGGGFGINKDLNQGLWKASVGFQNKKGDILNAGYMKINGQDYGVFEYNFSIFKIDR